MSIIPAPRPNAATPRVLGELRTVRLEQDEELGLLSMSDEEWFYEPLEKSLLEVSHRTRHPKARGSLRSKLLESAALMVAWVEDIDRRSVREVVPGLNGICCGDCTRCEER